MNQRTFILLFVGMLLVAVGIMLANSYSHRPKTLGSAEIEKSSISTNAPLETIIWESMGQAILGSGSVN